MPTSYQDLLGDLAGTLQPAGVTILAVITAGALTFGCVATPLPLPPNVDPELVTIEQTGTESVTIQGARGAIEPGNQIVRITSVTPPDVIGRVRQNEWIELLAGNDGSFVAALVGTRQGDIFFFEALEEDEDLFLIALEGGEGSSAVEANPGDDSDGDGSPDYIDCSPGDDALAGRRCP